MTKISLWCKGNITCMEGATLERKEEHPWSAMQNDYQINCTSVWMMFNCICLFVCFEGMCSGGRAHTCHNTWVEIRGKLVEFGPDHPPYIS